MVDELPKDITDPERASPPNPVTGGSQGGSTENTPTGDFSSYMKEGNVPGSEKSAKDPSPLELQKPSQAASSPPSIKTMQDQIQATNSSYSTVKSQLHSKGLKLKQGEKQVVRDKLNEADQNVRAANKTLGASPGPAPNLSKSKNPIARYLDLVSDGQQQLQSATNLASQLGKQKPGSVSPAKMLLVQAKLSHAQQAIDFTSVLLGKAIEFIKTTMQTQI